MKRIEVSKENIQDALNLAGGVYAPLEGFLYSQDFYSVLEKMRLSDGSIWSIPIILDINKETAYLLRNEKEIKIVNRELGAESVLENIQIYNFDKNEMAQKVFGTLNEAHPGVAEVMNMGDYLLGGKIVEAREGNRNKNIPPFSYYYSPKETRKIFKQNGWKKIVAFQTRNVPHLGHEFLQKQALGKADGLFIQPVIGKKKPYDFNDECIISAYKVLIEKFFKTNTVLLGALPLKMRYAGPREALMHALVRRNFGCTHFVVGRDHAGVGNFYAPDAAQEIFDRFSPRELGIEILKLGEVVFNSQTGRHCFEEDCEEENKVKFSGTKLRDFIKNKKQPPEYLIRREIFEILKNHPNPLSD